MIDMGRQSQACGELFRHLVKAMTRDGVLVGEAPEYPRAEITSVNEQDALDKGGEVRQVAVTIDSMSSRSLGEAMDVSAGNLAGIRAAEDMTENFRILGVTESTASTMEDMTETSAVLYRVINNLTFYLQKK